MTMSAGRSRRIVFQSADIHKPLLSVSRATDAGFECRLGKAGGVMVDLRTGDAIPIARRHNLYILKARVRADKGDGDKGFHRQE